ncbi:MAG: energy transducer TonB [Candidatus Angelobacter sp.]
MEGPRVALTGQENKGKSVFVALGKSVRVEIRLDRPLNSLDDAQALLERVFFFQDVREHSKPELRRSDDPTANQPIYHVSPEDKLLPPQATYTPEPAFSEEARRARFQGTVVLRIVVDKLGNVARVRLEHALGHGLDENAMEGVKIWRFRPTTRNGEPVAVEMHVEVSFNLY